MKRERIKMNTLPRYVFPVVSIDDNDDHSLARFPNKISDTKPIGLCHHIMCSVYIVKSATQLFKSSDEWRFSYAFCIHCKRSFRYSTTEFLPTHFRSGITLLYFFLHFAHPLHVADYTRSDSSGVDVKRNEMKWKKKKSWACYIHIKWHCSYSDDAFICYSISPRRRLLFYYPV